MDTAKYIKSILSLNGMTITKLAKLLTEKTGRKYTLNTLSARINRESITIKEITIIAEILGYKFELVQK